MTRPECHREFVRILAAASRTRDQRGVFCDFCRAASLSLRGALVFGAEKADIERQYAAIVTEYGKDGMTAFSHMLAVTVKALEANRSDFLGHLYEELNATNKHFGQFFTPDSVSRLMAEMTIQKTIPGQIVTMYDAAAGAGALLIEGAEHFVAAGGRQCDILISADDLDATACCIAYIQLSLLGYAAIVRRMDSLRMEVYEGPWFTFGYFAHSMPMRLRPSKPMGATAPASPASPVSPALPPISRHNAPEASEGINHATQLTLAL